MGAGNRYRNLYMVPSRRVLCNLGLLGLTLEFRVETEGVLLIRRLPLLSLLFVEAEDLMLLDVLRVLDDWDGDDLFWICVARANPDTFILHISRRELAIGCLLIVGGVGQHRPKWCDEVFALEAVDGEAL